MKLDKYSPLNKYPEAKKLYEEGKTEEAMTLWLEKAEEERRLAWNSESFIHRLNRLSDYSEDNKIKLMDLVFEDDKIVINTTPNMISSSISITYSNSKYGDKEHHFSLPNNINSWTLLKKADELLNMKKKPHNDSGVIRVISGIENSGVFYEEWKRIGKDKYGYPVIADNSTIIPLTDSIPYKHRFSS